MRGKNKIAVLGGSFDPVHTAHTDIAAEVLKMPDIKKVIFVPAYAAPHKTEQFADINERITMLKLALKDIKRTEISFFEAEKQDVVYSYQTLDYFQGLYPDNEVTMIIGSDSLRELHTWKNIDYLASRYKFIVAKRPDAPVSAANRYFDRCIFIDAPMENISSTNIRKLLQEGDEEAGKFLNGDVYDYIKEYGLYK